MKAIPLITSDMRKIYSGSITVFIGMLIHSGAQFLLILVLGRVLGPAAVGLFLLGRTVMRFANLGSTFGMTGSLLKFIPEYLGRKQHDLVYKILHFAFATGFVLSLIIATALYFAAPFLSIHLFADKNLISVLQLFAICLPFFTILTIIISTIRSFRDMVAYAFIENIMLPGGLILLTLLFFVFSESIHSVIYAFFLSISAAIIVGSIFLKRNMPTKTTKSKNKIDHKRIITYSIPFMGSDYIGLTLLWMDTFLIGILMNAEAVGIYNGAIKIALLCKLTLVSVNSVFGPTISKLYTDGDLKGIESVYKNTVRWIMHLSLPVFLIIFLFPKHIMGLYGSEFVSGSTALVILAAGQLISLSVGSAGSLLNMTGRPNIEFFNRMLALGLNFFLNLYLIPLMGITGAALATASSTSLINILRLLENYRFLNIHPYSFRLIYPFLKKMN